MHLSTADIILWAAGFLGHVALLFVLFYRRGWKSFPWFSFWVFYVACRTMILFLLHLRGLSDLYSRVYWYGQIVELFFQILVLWDISRNVFRPGGEWIPGARKLLCAGILLAALIAVGLSFAATPSAPTSLWRWLIRGNLFAAGLVFELALAVTLTAQHLGLPGRSRVNGLSQGLMIWCGITFCVEAAHGYFGYNDFYKFLVHIRMYAYLAALAWWIVVFWKQERQSRPLSPELRDALARIETSFRPTR